MKTVYFSSIATLFLCGCGSDGSTSDSNGDTSTQSNLQSAPTPTNPLGLGGLFTQKVNLSANVGGNSYTGYLLGGSSVADESAFIVSFSKPNGGLLLYIDYGETYDATSYALTGVAIETESLEGLGLPCGTDGYSDGQMPMYCTEERFALPNSSEPGMTLTVGAALPATLTVGDSGQVASGTWLNTKFSTIDKFTLKYDVVSYSSLYVGLVETATWSLDDGASVTLTMTYGVPQTGGPVLISVEVASNDNGTFDITFKPVPP
jgi:hypothetical protein